MTRSTASDTSATDLAATAVGPASAPATSLSRRGLLKLGALGAGATVAGLVVPLGRSASTADWASTLPSSKIPRPYTTPLPMQPTLPYREMTDGDGPYRLYTVSQRLRNVQILTPLPGEPLTTPAFVYGWTGLDGQPKSSVPGPVISVPRGTRTRLRMKNELPGSHPQFGSAATTSTHLHGSASLPQYDGYADDLTAPGSYKDYEYPNVQPSRTLWYHDHGAHHTAKNAYSGLAAQYHIHDEAEQALLPQGEFDVPLTISDALFDSAGRLLYDDDDSSGLWGDVILVNGTPWPYMDVKRRVYRFRILMASLSRSASFRLVNVATGQAVPVHFVATDGGMMPKRQTVTSWRQASAERYEILVDFGAFESLPAGSKFELRNTSPKNNRTYLHTGKVMQFRLSGPQLPRGGRGNEVPDTLVSSTAMGLTAAQASRTRHVELDHEDLTNQFLIDGKSWKDVQASNYSLLVDGTNPDVGAVEIWEVENKSGGWFHPLHIHLVDFKILSRSGGSGSVRPWEKGPKDTVYVGEGETVRLLMKYEMPTGGSGPAGRGASAGGRYMVHCHNLPHEDNDMMQQFQVGRTPEVNDPITTARPQRIPADGVYRDGREQTPDRV